MLPEGAEAPKAADFVTHQRKQGLPAQYWHHDGARFNADVTMRDLSWRRERLHGDEVDDLRMPAWPRIKCR